MVESDPVWRALNSPHRRRILDLLRSGPLSTGQIAKQLPGISRFATMQHLDVLVDANLVLVRKEGRSRFNFANPAPIHALVDRWVSGYAAAAANTARHLKRYAENSQRAESNMNDRSPSFRVVKIELEQEIAASKEVVFEALTSRLNEWWPYRIKPDSAIRHDAVVGGTIAEVWPGGGALYGQITVFEPGVRVAAVAHGFMGQACTIANDESVEPRGDRCIYRKSLRIWGEVPEATERMFAEGSVAIVKDALKRFCEEGVRYDHNN